MEDVTESSGGKVSGFFYTAFLILGVLFPGLVILVEVLTKLSASNFFDPLPSFWHFLAVSFVPLINLLLLQHLYKGKPKNVKVLSLLAPIAIGISAYYSLIYLPVLPAGIFGIIILGLGLLAFGPLVSFISATVLYTRLAKTFSSYGISGTNFWKGLAAAAIILVLLDLPLAVTTLGIQWAGNSSFQKSRQGIQLLRNFGNRDLMLAQCYGNTRTFSGPLTLAFMLTKGSSEFVSPSEVREIYYKVTGEPFSTRPAPGRWDSSEWTFDIDQGGTEVGGRLKDLDLVASTLDGYLKTDEAVSYLEWIMEFKNSSPRQQEARLQMALPPKAVVSRVSLWVNGEEREAAFAGRQKVREAYQQVVRARRDPLLVTTDGADRILAQAFPVPPNGTIKFKVGISAPLSVNTLDKASLVLPAIYDRNFNIDNELKHSVWIESDKSMQSTSNQMASKQIRNNLFRLTGKISDLELTKPRSIISGTRNPEVTRAWGQLNGKTVIQEVLHQEKKLPEALVMVLDGSDKSRPFIDELVASLDAIPNGQQIGLFIANESETTVPVQPWSPDQKEVLIKAIRGSQFVGGQDNATSLSEAFQALEAFSNAEVLWIHTPQPVVFSNSHAVMEQVANRIARLPHVSRYELLPGANKLLDDSRWILNSETLINTGHVKEDLRQYFQNTFNENDLVIRRYLSSQPGNLPKGSDHIARLWAQDTVYEKLREPKDEGRNEALKLAVDYNLVTPVSGAVVLETQDQYKANDLKPVDANKVPTIPEPEQWILIFLIMVFLAIWFIRQRKQNLLKA